MKKIISEDSSNTRLDIFLTNELSLSRSNITKHIKDGSVTVNGKVVKGGYLLKEGDVVEYTDWCETTTIKPENIPLDIYYEDEYIMVVNKKSGMVVHPGSGNYSNTLVYALMVTLIR